MLHIRKLAHVTKLHSALTTHLHYEQRIISVIEVGRDRCCGGCNGYYKPHQRSTPYDNSTIHLTTDNSTIHLATDNAYASSISESNESLRMLLYNPGKINR